jgi:hypothetical protein
MATDLHLVRIFHITDVENLASIRALGGLRCDAAMTGKTPLTIGYDHIKQRRLQHIPIPCCGHRFVGEFVPFYYCPRSPMLYAINQGHTGRPAGCQRSILHLVSTVSIALELYQPWAVSDGNAGAFHTLFHNNLDALAQLPWAAIQKTQWQGASHHKQAEFLVADFFPWSAIVEVGCHNEQTAARVRQELQGQAHCPLVHVKPEWYY